jgi:hypothetical protein
MYIFCHYLCFFLLIQKLLFALTCHGFVMVIGNSRGYRISFCLAIVEITIFMHLYV